MPDKRGAADSPARVLLLGGTSEIGLEILAALGLSADTEVLLAGRDEQRMAAAGKELGVRARTLRFDATALDSHQALIDEAFAGGDVDLVISAAGVLTGQQILDRDPLSAGLLVETNFTGHVTTLLAAAAADARPGPRHHRGAVLDRRDPAPQGQLRVRGGQVRPGCLRPRAGRLAARQRSAGAAGPAGLRDRPDDGGHDPGPAGHHAGRRGRRRGRPAPPGGRHRARRPDLGAVHPGPGGGRASGCCPGRCGAGCPAEAGAPRCAYWWPRTTVACARR